MSTTDKLRTFQEMDVEDAFIQYLEELRSGTPGGVDGLNRPLSQLARNTDALLDVLQASRSMVLAGGSSFAWDAATGTLAWDSAITFHFAHELSGAVTNVLAAGFILLSAPGKLVYVKFDREVNGSALTAVVVSSVAAFVAVLEADAEHRLDYQVFAYRDGANIVFGDGRRLRTGYLLDGNGYTDTQYGQQTELTQVHDNQKENFKVVLTGGGTIFWDATEVSATVGRLHWTEPFVVKLPATDGEIEITGDAVGPEYTKNLEDGDVLWITLARQLVGTTSVAVTVSPAGVGPLAGDNAFVLAVREGDRVYFWSGTALSDGDTVLLGGVRSGVQWFHGVAGNGDQVTDFGSTKTYRTGTGELMVYRNGVKARASAATWSGVFPAGSLVGTLEDDAQYVEEDTNGDGTGHRVLWVPDDGNPFLSHPVGTHAPGDPFTEPDTDDWLEAFVGVMGDGPSPVESIGIEGEPAQLEGDVKVRGEGGISTAYDGNTIVFTLDAGAGVTSLNGLGAAVEIEGGRLIEVTDDGIGTITVALDVSDDKADAIDGMLGNMEGDEDASASNPLVARQWVLDGIPPVSGFDIVRTLDANTVAIGPGRLRLGDVVRVQTERIEVTTADILSSDTIASSTWHYVYVGAPRSAGEEVGGYVSTTPPGTDGRHPDSETLAEGELWFVSSVYIDGGAFRPFVRRGCDVLLDQPIDLTDPATGTSTVDLSSALPGTGVSSARVRLTVGQVNPAAANPQIQYGQASSTLNTVYGASGDGAWNTFEIDTPLGADLLFSLSLSSTYWSVVVDFKLVGFSEGQYSVGSGLWS